MAHTVWFENSHYDKLRSSLRAMCSSKPEIRLRPVFTPLTWASDPLIMFQNGIRFQLIDLFTMLHETAIRIDTIKLAQCTAVREWVTEIGHMVALYFHVQERVILPELTASQPGPCFIQALREVTVPLIKMLISIHASALKLERAARRRDENSFASRDDDIYNSFRQMSELIFAFAVDSEKRFSQEITDFVPILKKGTMAGSRNLQRRCFLELLRFEEGERIFRGYSARLPSDVRDYCLTGFDAFRMKRIKSSERKWRRKRKNLRKQLLGDKYHPPRRALQIL